MELYLRLEKGTRTCVMWTGDPTTQNRYLNISLRDQRIGYQITPLIREFLNGANEEALKNGGYRIKLEYRDWERSNMQKRRNRPRKILWFNLPYNMEVVNNLGKEFFIYYLYILGRRKGNLRLGTITTERVSPSRNIGIVPRYLVMCGRSKIKKGIDPILKYIYIDR